MKTLHPISLYKTIQKLAYALLITLLICSASFGQSERSTKAPEVQSFSLNPDLKGIGENSVNLYSGDVNLPVPLVSLPGRGGLDVNVTMSYNSNIQHIEDAWNLDAPTSILGLGWSMNYDRIVVDHKQTGNRHDDEFYLISGGTSNRLIQTGYDPSNSAIKTYETKNYQFWKIRYIPYDERWEIIKEDGNKLSVRRRIIDQCLRQQNQRA